MMRLTSVVTACSALLANACGDDKSTQDPDASALRAPEHGPVPAPPEHADDPWTEAKANLGKHIFFDTRLSNSGKTSCNSCHLYVTSFQDNLQGGVPDSAYPHDSPALTRNTPSFLNMIYAPVVRWDGSHTDLVEVLAFPFAELNMNLGADVPSAQTKLKQRLTVDAPGYVGLFNTAFGQDITALPPADVYRLTGRALLAFIRVAVSRNAAFDRWNAGDDTAMTAKQIRGYQLFEGKAGCGHCHAGPLFTDFAFHNVSSSLPDGNGNRPDEGRYGVTHDPSDRGAFLTPSLRGVFATDPYFHDGSMITLQKVIRFKTSDAATQDPLHDPAFNKSHDLTDEEIDELVDFLRTLRGEDVASQITPPAPNTP